MRNQTVTIHGIENSLGFGFRYSIQHPCLWLISIVGLGLQPERSDLLLPLADGRDYRWQDGNVIEASFTPTREPPI